MERLMNRRSILTDGPERTSVLHVPRRSNCGAQLYLLKYTSRYILLSAAEIRILAEKGGVSIGVEDIIVPDARTGVYRKT